MVFSSAEAGAARPLEDERIERLRRCGDKEREQGIADLIVTAARTVAERLLQRYARGNAVSREDVEDIVATVSLRLLTRLRAAAASEEDPIERLDVYVASLTHNAVNDHLRRRFPQRARLKNRLRYTLTHDARLGLWTGADRLVCGLSQWRGRDAATGNPAPLPEPAAKRARDRERPAEAVVAYLQHCGGPVAFETLVDAMAELWQVFDAVPRRTPEPAEPSMHATAEWRQLLAELWREIVQLRPMQRKALLLNLRDNDASHVLSLFAFTKIASIADIAAALEITPAQLEEIWHELPFDDLRIAALLGLERQQVINLRKSARERLRRRLSQKRVS